MAYLTLHIQAGWQKFSELHTHTRKKILSKRMKFPDLLTFLAILMTLFQDLRNFMQTSASSISSLLTLHTKLFPLLFLRLHYTICLQNRVWKSYVYKQQKLKLPWDTKLLCTTQKLSKVSISLNFMLYMQSVNHNISQFLFNLCTNIFFFQVNIFFFWLSLPCIWFPDCFILILIHSTHLNGQIQLSRDITEYTATWFLH